MSFFAHFSVGFLLSFLGSMPPGIINLSVAESRVTKGQESAMYIALGAALVEGIQVLVAIKCASWFVTFPMVETTIEIAVIPVFLILGVYHLFKKVGDKKRQKSDKGDRLKDFLKGMFLSFLNFLAIPYWLFYGTWLGTNGWLKDDFIILVFVVGAFLGTVILLFTYGWLSLKIVSHLNKAERVANIALATLFLILGTGQLCKLLFT